MERLGAVSGRRSGSKSWASWTWCMRAGATARPAQRRDGWSARRAPDRGARGAGSAAERRVRLLGAPHGEGVPRWLCALWRVFLPGAERLAGGAWSYMRAAMGVGQCRGVSAWRLIRGAIRLACGCHGRHCELPALTHEAWRALFPVGASVVHSCFLVGRVCGALLFPDRPSDRIRVEERPMSCIMWLCLPSVGDRRVAVEPPGGHVSTPESCHKRRRDSRPTSNEPPDCRGRRSNEVLRIKMRAGVLALLALFIVSGITASTSSAAGPYWKVNGIKLVGHKKSNKSNSK